MSDASQGPGWWQASDGKWYPPEQAPGYQPPQPGMGAGGGGGGFAAAGMGGGFGQPATPDVGAALSYGWNKFLAHIGPIIIILLVIIGVQVVFTVISLGIDSIFVRQAVSAIGWAVSMIISLGLVRAGLAITRGEAPTPDLLFKTEGIGPYILASLLVGVGVTLGMILCILPGLLVMFFTWFYGFFIVDQNMGVGDSITASFNLVKDNAGTLALFLIVSILLSLCTCGLAAGVIWIATAYMYKATTGQPVAP